MMAAYATTAGKTAKAVLAKLEDGMGRTLPFACLDLMWLLQSVRVAARRRC